MWLILVDVQLSAQQPGGTGGTNGLNGGAGSVLCMGCSICSGGVGQGSSYGQCLASIKWHKATAGSGGPGAQYA